MCSSVGTQCNWDIWMLTTKIVLDYTLTQTRVMTINTCTPSSKHSTVTKCSRSLINQIWRLKWLFASLVQNNGRLSAIAVREDLLWQPLKVNLCLRDTELSNSFSFMMINKQFHFMILNRRQEFRHICMLFVLVTLRLLKIMMACTQLKEFL